MYAPAQHDEITGLVGYIDQQLTAIRSAAYGLTEEQARETPCRSALSIGGIIKHVAYVMGGSLERLRAASGTGEAVAQEIDEASYAEFMGSFVVADDSSVADTVKAFDEVREQFRLALAAVDPDAETTEPPAPWHGIFDARPSRARYHLVHMVEECARHAGHADIIREQIDGMAVPALVLSLEGAPANDFFEPYRPEPGTLLA